jgi:eukaryotic-like serine/threonine-protein kinase
MNIDANHVKAIFLTAVEKYSPDRWAAYLDEVCAGDQALRQRIEVLLQAHAGADSFFDHSDPSPVATVDERPLTEAPGTVIGPYKLLEQIGEGGFGVVFLAEQTQPVRRRVALKVLKPGMDTRQVIARFEAERQALALMDHPNIAQVHDGGTTPDGRPYFVMELVKGVPITEYCDQCRLTTRQRLDLFLAVCQAVQHAHQKGVIHRDIKPSNVLVAIQDGKPVVKVIDFGVAKAINQRLSEHTLLTGFHQLIGTPLYMSPEQAEMSPLDVDTRADIYSLGVLLYELLTGTTPFEKERLKEASYDELRRIIREEEPPRPSARLSTQQDQLTAAAAQRRTEPRQLLRTVRGELDWIVMKALEKDRTRRYETANGFAMDVQRYLADEPVLACPPSVGYRLRKFVRRNKGPVLAGSLILAALVIGIVGTTWGMIRANHAEAGAVREADEKTVALGEREKALATAKASALEAQKQGTLANENAKTARRQESLARRRFYAAQINLAHQAYQTGNLAQALAILETQRPRFDEEDLRTFEWYCLWQMCHQRLRFSWQLKIGNTYMVTISPNGAMLACANSDGRVTLFDTATGKERSTLREKSYGSEAVAFSADNRLLAQAAGPTADVVTLWDVATGRQSSVLRGTGKVVRLAFAPRDMLLAIGNTEGVIQLWDVAAGQIRASLQEAKGLIRGLVFSPDGKILAARSSGERLTHLWDVTAFPPKPLEPARVEGNDLAFSPDGKTLASTGTGRPFTLWDLAAKQEMPEKWRGSLYDIGTAIAFCPDGKTVALAGDARCVKLFDIVAGGHEELPHHELVQSLGISGDGKLLASVSADAVLKLWDLSRPAVAEPLPFPGSGPFIGISADGKKVALSSGDLKTVWVRDLAGGRLLTLKGHTQLYICTVRFSPDGRYLATGCRGGGPRDGGWREDPPAGEFKLWDLATGEQVAEVPGISVVSLAFSPDGNTVAIGAPMSETLILWDVATRQARVTLRDGWACPLVFSPDGKSLISGGPGRIDFRSAATGQTRVSVKVPGIHRRGQDTNVLACSPDGKLFATGQSEGSVWVGDMTTGRLHTSLTGHTGGINSVAFLPDSNTLAVASADGTARMWDVTAGQERLTFKNEARLAFAADGKTMAVITKQGVRLYRAATEPEALAYRSELNPGDPESPVAQINAADLLWAAGQNEEAKETYQKARLRLEKLAARFRDNADYQRELARIALTVTLVLSGKEQAAERHSVRAQAMAAFQSLPAEDQHTLVRRYVDLGESLRTAKRNPEAESAYTLAIELDPTFASAHFNLGNALSDQGKLAEAIACWRKAIDLDSKDAAAHNNVARAYALLGQRDQAVVYTGKLIPLRPSDNILWMTHASFLLRAGDTKGYRLACKEMIDRFGHTKDPFIAHRVAWTCLLLPDAVSDQKLLMELAQRSVDGAPRDPWTGMTLGLAHYRAGQFEQAVKALQPYAEMSWCQIQVSLILAMAHERLGKGEEASRLLNKAVKQMEMEVAAKVPGPLRTMDNAHVWAAYEILRGEAVELLKK